MASPNAGRTLPAIPGGAGGAAYQIEGGLQHSNMAAWEQGRNLECAGSACAAWATDFRNDLAALKESGSTVYRFSVEWSRLQPTRNSPFCVASMSKYARLVTQLRAQGVEPLVVLHHFSLPSWITLDDTTFPEAFETFATFVVTSLVGAATHASHEPPRYWITFNEPTLMLVHGYLIGRRPPGHAWSWSRYRVAWRNIKEAHERVYRLLHRKLSQTAMVSIAENQVVASSAQWWNPMNRVVTYGVHRFLNYVLLDALEATIDFVGVNHYNHITVTTLLRIHMTTHTTDVSDMGWDVRPRSIYDVCRATYRRYRKPIFVTEHGVAEHDDQDLLRTKLLMAAAVSMRTLVNDDAIPVIGYVHWSLMDNHEWEQGKRMRFGLFHTDYASSTLRPRDSVATFKRIADQLHPPSHDDFLFAC